MSTIPQTAATLDDLLRIDGKAELIGGRIIPIMPTGRRPNLVAGRIYRSLAGFVDTLRRGDAYTDNMGFTVAELTSGRQSFSPDVAYYDGPLPENSMRFIDGPPTFAVEVRHEGDYGPSAEAEMAAKRADYFEAGTLVVWDVDPVDDCIRVFRADTLDRPKTFCAGQQVDAEAAVPGWRMAVGWAFDVTG